MEDKKIAQVAVSTIKGSLKQEIYPRTIDKAVITTDSEGTQKTLDKVMIKGIKVNGTLSELDSDGTVNLVISGINSVSTSEPADGTFILSLSNGTSIVIDLNHNHPQYAPKKTIVENSDSIVTLSSDIIYDLGTVSGNKTINLPEEVEDNAEYEFRLVYTDGTISGTALSSTSVANDDSLIFTTGKTYQVIISGGILYFSETTTPS